MFPASKLACSERQIVAKNNAAMIPIVFCASLVPCPSE